MVNGRVPACSRPQTMERVAVSVRRKDREDATKVFPPVNVTVTELFPPANPRSGNRPYVQNCCSTLTRRFSRSNRGLTHRRDTGWLGPPGR
jgi:hypothetical protein